MNKENIKLFLTRIETVFNETGLNKLGKDLEFSVRERKITPYKLGLALIKAFSCTKIESIADIHRCFNALHRESVAYKPFYNQLSKPNFADFMRKMTEMVMQHLVIQILAFDNDNTFSEFETVYLQDGSSFAIEETLREIFPGRFKTVNPAAVELHVTVDLYCDNPVKIDLAPDTNSEGLYLPEPEELINCLLLADRGYPSNDYVSKVESCGGFYLMRQQGGIKPIVEIAYDENGKIITKFLNKKLKDIKKKLPKRASIDMDVKCKTSDEKDYIYRLVITWNSSKKEYQYLMTNLSREKYTTQQIILAYKLRWQIELLFKEWKSYANLHAFDTNNEYVAEGFIWASIIAATIKRFVAHAAQNIFAVGISTRIVAMAACNVLPDFIQSLINGTRKSIFDSFNTMLKYFAEQCKRSSLKRERRSGRLQSGIKLINVNA